MSLLDPKAPGYPHRPKPMYAYVVLGEDDSPVSIYLRREGARRWLKQAQRNLRIRRVRLTVLR